MLQQNPSVSQDSALMDHVRLKRAAGNSADFYYQKGIALRKQGNYTEAIVAFDKAISLNPNDADFYDYKGNCLYYLNKYTGAIVAYDKAISLNSNNADFYLQKGITLRTQGKNEESITAMAISINPNNTDFYFEKEVTLRQQCKNAEAMVAYNKAISMIIRQPLHESINYTKYVNSTEESLIRHFTLYEENVTLAGET